MEMSDTTRKLDLLEPTANDDGGCGCGGCGCQADADAASRQETGHTDTDPGEESAMTTRTYPVTGMTCGHCASAVTSELTALDGVGDVQVDLVPGGASTVTVRSDRPLPESQVVAALEEAGGYRLG